MKMKKVIIILLFMMFSLPLFAEYVFLKDGQILKGTIVSETSKTIKLKNKNGDIMIIRRNTVMRVLYTEFYMGKVYVQKTDGTGMELYKVDEDRETYTFRKDLYKPQEIVIKRSDVLFMARKNPTGLKGKASQTEIELQWNKPYSEVKYYNVYIKTDADEYFKKIDKVTKTECTIENLKSNTHYSIIVKAVDTENYESLPSNRVEVTTLNILPEKPDKASLILPEEGQEGDPIIKWSDAVDPDGKIIKYNIYIKVDGEFKKIASVEGTEYIVKDFKEGQVYYIKSVDDKGDESEKYVKTYSMWPLVINSSLSFVLPLGDFRSISKYGAAFRLGVHTTNFYKENIQLGFETGLIYYFPVDDLVEMNISVPLYLTAGYQYAITKEFSVTGVFGIGAAYNYLSSDIDGSKDNGIYYVSDWAIEPVYEIGIVGKYKINDFVSLSADLYYYSVLEKSGALSLMTISLGADFNIDL